MANDLWWIVGSAFDPMMEARRPATSRQRRNRRFVRNMAHMDCHSGERAGRLSRVNTVSPRRDTAFLSHQPTRRFHAHSHLLLLLLFTLLLLPRRILSSPLSSSIASMVMRTRKSLVAHVIAETESIIWNCEICWQSIGNTGRLLLRHKEKASKLKLTVRM
jgi:hypothetical protein